MSETRLQITVTASGTTVHVEPPPSHYRETARSLLIASHYWAGKAAGAYAEWKPIADSLDSLCESVDKLKESE